MNAAAAGATPVRGWFPRRPVNRADKVTTVRKAAPNRKPFLFGLAEICAVGVMVAAFIIGTVIVQYIFNYPDLVNFKQCLPWFILFTFVAMYFNSVFDLSRRIYHLVFSAFVSILLVNLFMMALPFFAMLYYVRLPTLFADIILEFIGMLIWVAFFHWLWVARHPPSATAVICDDKERGQEISRKIAKHSPVNRVEAVLSYDCEDFFGTIDKFDTLILVKPPAEKRNEIALSVLEQAEAALHRSRHV